MASMQAAVGSSEDGVRRLRFRDGRRRQRHRRPARPLEGAGRRRTSHVARSWRTTSPSPGSSRGPRTCRPTRGHGQLRRLQGGGRTGDARPPRASGFPARSRPGRHLRARQQHLRHGGADVPAPPPVPAHPPSPRRTGRHLLRARRRPVRRHGRHGRRACGARRDLQHHGRRPFLGATWSSWRTSSAPSPTSCSCRTTSADHRPTCLRAPVRSTPPRHRQHREGGEPPRLPAPLRREERSRADVRVVPRPGLGDRTDLLRDRSGERAGTSMPRRNWPRDCGDRRRRSIGRPSDGVVGLGGRDRAPGHPPCARRRSAHPPGGDPSRRAGHLRRAARS